MKSLTRKRREAGAICDVCRSPDYKELPPYIDGGKPNFICNSCGNAWQYGRNGGKYSELSEDKEAPK